MSFKKNWLLINCVRPKEPSFTPKCDDAFFIDIPNDYFPERYRGIANDLENRFRSSAGTTVSIPRITVPDLNFATLKRRGTFSVFNPKHREISSRLISMLMESKSEGEFMALGAYLKDRINPHQFQYAYQVALKHHPMTKDLPLPSVVEQFPEMFVDPVTFPMLREETSVVEPGSRAVIEIPVNFTATDKEDEQRLAYFREDIGTNMHHWHWHMVYPLEGPIEIVNKDRRGELFYYMHGQLVARYDSERLCNGMPLTVPFFNFREPIKEGYYAKLIRNINQRAYATRPPNTVLSDINRPEDGVVITINQFNAWLDNILMAIDQGFAIASNGTQVPLNNNQGIDVLGNMIEASILSVNPGLYGDWHNAGHFIFGYAHDPDGRYLEDVGPMGDTTTAMRDPVFYRFHKHVHNVFDRHKRLLPQYTPFELGYQSIQIVSVTCQIPRENAAPNVLLTFWQRSQVDLSGGLDFAANGRALVSFVHLQHADFNYVIDITSNSGRDVSGTCRIFLAPKMDENCRPFHFNEQRKLMIELDKFTVNLKPGHNRIARPSLNSSVTISWENSFKAIGQLTQLAGQLTPEQMGGQQFCGCGWPHHLLIPKGSEDGTPFELFVMVSNFELDVVNGPIDENTRCGDAHSFCGLQDQLYPDSRPMGYPFDRPFDVASLAEFANMHENMFKQDITIRFANRIVERRTE